MWILFNPASIFSKLSKIIITGGRGRRWRKSFENWIGGWKRNPALSYDPMYFL